MVHISPMWMRSIDRAQEFNPLTDSDGGYLSNDIKAEMENRCRLVKENLNNFAHAM